MARGSIAQRAPRSGEVFVGDIELGHQHKGFIIIRMRRT